MGHFLSVLTSRGAARCVLRNTRTGAMLATRVEPAFDSARRRRGLLGRTSFPSGEALVLAPCAAIHTCFMAFAIDVVFARRDGEVVKVRTGVKPWRATYALGAFAAIEFASGAALDVRRGDRLRLDAD
jgi:uncharacterized membrane protein (UPF0127 family)